MSALASFGSGFQSRARKFKDGFVIRICEEMLYQLENLVGNGWGLEIPSSNQGIPDSAPSSHRQGIRRGWSDLFSNEAGNEEGYPGPVANLII
ncbi:hypothetical protein FNV43_RR12930 [Rhamnella rubrinervis]|uniref:Uncharacterized protein n=1 Tax=Rhamnella rubrinervis TaxID=2594499 RepID=A0A8K0H090_9ROSA|nr:hypothetical protein FNV43_RR12930 [Rhamnella rubrinervis]